MCGRDSDALFAYTTTKLVRIQDRRLGIIKYAFWIAIFVYIAGIQLGYYSGYLQVFDPTGTIRYSLRQPTIDQDGKPGCDPVTGNPPFVDPSEFCHSDYAPLSQASYCLQSGVQPGCPLGKYPSAHTTDSDGKPYCFNQYVCQINDFVDDQIVAQDSISMATYVQEVEQTRACSRSGTFNGTCPQVWKAVLPISESNVRNDQYFVAGLENYTVLIEHSVHSLGAGVDAVSRNMDGKLAVPDNSELCAEKAAEGKSVDSSGKPTSTAPCFIYPKKGSAQKLDVFTINDLVRASNSYFDDWNQIPPKPGKPVKHSVRYSGVVLLLNIQYTNVRHFDVPGNVSYTYHVSALPSSNPKFIHSVESTNMTHRVVQKRYSIKLQAIYTGTLGKFVFLNLLLQLTTSLTLFAVATTVTDYLAIYGLPDRKLYYNAKYELTEDFSDIREARLSMSASANEGAPQSMGVSTSGLKDPLL